MSSPDEKVLDTVSKLIERANHAGTNDAEREACLDKADILMKKHAIDMAMLEQSKSKEQKQVPVSAKVSFPGYRTQWYYEFSDMMAEIARTARVKVAFHPSIEAAYLVGFSEDVEYAQMVWLSVYLAFSSKLEPSWDKTKDADENIKILKEAGWKWQRIAEAGGFDWPDGGKLKRAYRRQCAKEGVEPTAHTQRHKAYRASFADSFSTAVRLRLIRQREAGEELEKETTGAELALRDRFSYVEDKFYELFPELHPDAHKERLDAMRKAEEERRSKLSDKDREAEDARNARQRARWAREYRMSRDDAGSRAGTAAGNSVDLSASKNAVGSPSARQIR